MKFYFFKLFFILAFFVSIPHLVVAQQDLQSQLAAYMQMQRKGETSSPVPKALYKNDQPHLVLNKLETYYADSVADVRNKAYYIIYRLGLENKEVASLAVENLTFGLKDPESGIVGRLADYLMAYHQSDFSPEAKDTLLVLLERGTPHYKKLIKLAGFVRPEGAMEVLNKKFQEGDYSDASEQWTVLLALSRMGDQKAIDRCLYRVRKMPVNDDFVYEIAPDLVYSRQKRLIKPLIDILISEKKNCHSPNPESPEKMVCGYRIMEYLAPVVKDFPLETGPGGSIQMDDYKEALKISREWFIKNEADYQLLTGSF